MEVPLSFFKALTKYPQTAAILLSGDIVVSANFLT